MSKRNGGHQQLSLGEKRSSDLARFLVCTSPPNTGTDQIAVLHVRKEGYRPASREVRLGFFDKRHIELLIN